AVAEDNLMAGVDRLAREGLCGGSRADDAYVHVLPSARSAHAWRRGCEHSCQTSRTHHLVSVISEVSTMSESPFRCGMEAVVDLVGGKWKLLILFYVSRQRLRFSELRRLVGDVSEKMLSQQLKEMVADG